METNNLIYPQHKLSLSITTTSDHRLSSCILLSPLGGIGLELSSDGTRTFSQGNTLSVHHINGDAASVTCYSRTDERTKDGRN